MLYECFRIPFSETIKIVKMLTISPIMTNIGNTKYFITFIDSGRAEIEEAVFSNLSGQYKGTSTADVEPFIVGWCEYDFASLSLFTLKPSYR